jgi:HPt (histidine-containing phosphotransfer) domain-containing protein
MPPTHIDLGYLERLFKGDNTRMAQWIRMYLEEAPGTFQRLADSVEQGDAEQLAAVVHDLRPYAHYLGAERMLELLIAIGQRGRTDGAAAAVDLVKEVLDLSRAAEDELRAALSRCSNGTEPV